MRSIFISNTNRCLTASSPGRGAGRESAKCCKMSVLSSWRPGRCQTTTIGLTLWDERRPSSAMISSSQILPNISGDFGPGFRPLHDVWDAVECHPARMIGRKRPPPIIAVHSLLEVDLYLKDALHRTSPGDRSATLPNLDIETPRIPETDSHPWTSGRLERLRRVRE